MAPKTNNKKEVHMDKFVLFALGGAVAAFVHFLLGKNKFTLRALLAHILFGAMAGALLPLFAHLLADLGKLVDEAHAEVAFGLGVLVGFVPKKFVNKLLGLTVEEEVDKEDE